MTPGDISPKRGARQSDLRGKAQGAVDSDQHAESANAKADPQRIPETDDSAGKQDNPPQNGKNDDGNLSSQQSVDNEKMSLTERFAFWTLLATAGLAIATFGLALATVDMARSTRQLADLAKQQAADTKDALGIGRRQAAAAEAANQISDAPSLGVSQYTVGLPVAKSKYTASVSIYNGGHAPAIDVSGAVSLTISKAPFAALSPTSVCDDCSSAILFPSSGLNGQSLSFDSFIEADKITQDVVDGVKSNSLVVYMTASFAYKDARRKQHHIHICVFYKPDGNQTSPCATGNATD